MKPARLSQAVCSTPWTTKSGKEVRTDRWAAARKVWEAWESKGAPKRIMVAWSTGVRISERRRAMRAVCR